MPFAIHFTSTSVHLVNSFEFLYECSCVCSSHRDSLSLSLLLCQPLADYYLIFHVTCFNVRWAGVSYQQLQYKLQMSHVTLTHTCKHHDIHFQQRTHSILSEFNMQLHVVNRIFAHNTNDYSSFVIYQSTCFILLLIFKYSYIFNAITTLHSNVPLYYTLPNQPRNIVHVFKYHTELFSHISMQHSNQFLPRVYFVTEFNLNA